MIEAIVFSKDRPMQLDALLRSIRRHAPFLYGRIHVLVACSTDLYRNAYGVCQSENTHATFVPELEFRPDLLGMLPADGLLAFHCDDDLFYRDFAWPPIYGEQWSPHLFAYSLRLGLNTHYHYQPAWGDQLIPKTNPWSWAEADGDFGYPFSLDGHLYDAAKIRSLLKLLDFASPNELEAAGDYYVRADPNRWGFLIACSARSSVLSVPANRVQDVIGNRYADRSDWAPGVLLDRYLADERIDLDAIDEQADEVMAAHQELELSFCAHARLG